MKPNGQLNTKIRHLMPYAIITCEILTNDYFLQNYIQCQFRLLNQNKILNKNNLKEHFYNVIPKEIQKVKTCANKRVENEKQQKLKGDKASGNRKEIKFIANLGDVKVTRTDSSDTKLGKRCRNSLFEHIERENSPNLSNQQPFNLLGLNVNNNNNSNSIYEKPSFKFPKISLNQIKKVPPIEIVSSNSANLIPRFKQTLRNDPVNCVPTHDYACASIIESLNKINSYKINSLLANEISNELSYSDDASKLLESQNHNKISKLFGFLNKQSVQSSSIEFEKVLFEKFSLMNNNNNFKHHNSQNTAQVEKPEVAQQPQIQEQVEQEKRVNVSSIPKISIIDSITDNLDAELLFDLNQNLSNEESSLLNFDRDLFNSICKDIKENGPLPIIDDLPDFEANQQQNSNKNNISQANISNTNNNYLNQQNEIPTYNLKLFINEIEKKQTNSRLLINGITNFKKQSELNDFEKLLVDPRYNCLIEKFSRKIKCMLHRFFPQQQQNNVFVDEINKFCEKCEKKMKIDPKCVNVSQIMEIIKLIDFNIDFLNRKNYSNLRIDLGKQSTKDLRCRVLSNLYSYDCFLNELKIYLFQFFEYFFAEIFTSCKLVFSILQVNTYELNHRALSVNSVDPRSYRGAIDEINFENLLFFTKPFQAIKNNYKQQEGSSNVKMILEEIDASISSDFLQSTMNESNNLNSTKTNEYNDCLNVGMEIEVDYDTICLNSQQFPADLSDILRDDIISMEINKLVELINSNDRSNNLECSETSVEKTTKEKPSEVSLKEAKKFNFKPFKINNPCSLISEIHSVFEKEKSQKKKNLLKRERSKSTVCEITKLNRSTRSMSEADTNKIEIVNEELMRKNESMELLKVLNKIDEINENKNLSESDSDREENNVSITVAKNQEANNDSNFKLSKVVATESESVMSSLNSNNSNRFHYDNFKFRKNDRHILAASSKSNSNTDKESETKSKKKLRSSLSHSRSPLNDYQASKNSSAEVQNALSRSRSNSRSRTSKSIKSKFDRHKLDRSNTTEREELSPLFHRDQKRSRDKNINENARRDKRERSRPRSWDRKRSRSVSRSSGRNRFSKRSRSRSRIRRSRSRSRARRSRSRSVRRQTSSKLERKSNKKHKQDGSNLDCLNRGTSPTSRCRSDTPLSTSSLSTNISASSQSSKKTSSLLKQIFNNSSSNQRRIQLNCKNDTNDIEIIQTKVNLDDTQPNGIINYYNTPTYKSTDFIEQQQQIYYNSFQQQANYFNLQNTSYQQHPYLIYANSSCMPLNYYSNYYQSQPRFNNYYHYNNQRQKNFIPALTYAPTVTTVESTPALTSSTADISIIPPVTSIPQTTEK